MCSCRILKPYYLFQNFNMETAENVMDAIHCAKPIGHVIAEKLAMRPGLFLVHRELNTQALQLCLVLCRRLGTKVPCCDHLGDHVDKVMVTLVLMPPFLFRQVQEVTHDGGHQCTTGRPNSRRGPDS